MLGLEVEYGTILTFRLDGELAHRWGEFRERFNINSSDFLRTALIERMAKWPELAASTRAADTHA